MPTYTRGQLKADINSKIKGKIGILTDSDSTINQGVRQVLSEMDMVSMRRRMGLIPNLFTGLFEYTVPEDLKGYAVITVENQKWTKRPFWRLVPYEQFLRRQDNLTMAFSDYNGQRRLFIKSDENTFGNNGNVEVTLSSLDTLTSGGGIWQAFGDAINVVATNDNFVEGVGSIKFDTIVDPDTAGIFNSGLTSSDISAFLQGNGNSIAWSYLVSKDTIASFTLRLGSDDSNYYEKVFTNDPQNGWNNLDFNFSTFTTVGTPISTAITYCALFLTFI